MRRTAILLAALALGAVACAFERDPDAGSGRLEAVSAGALEFAEWLIPLAAGTSVVEYAAVPAEDRRGKVVTLEPELIVGGELSDRRSAFFHANDVAVDAAGRMYISDSGNYRVQVFEADGTFARSLGGRGQGPGELEAPRELEITDDRILVWDGRRRRLITWDMEGNPADDIHLEGVSSVSDMELAGDGASLVVLHSRLFRGPEGELHAGATQNYLVQSFSLDGTPETTYLEFPSTFMSQRPTPEFAVSGSGTVYVSTTEEYQVHAFPRDGSPWALRVDWQRRSTDEEIERYLSFVEQYAGGVPAGVKDPDAMGFGELHSALVGIRVDGHGYVYVAVNLSIDERRALQLQLHAERLPIGVDVYSPEGQHLFSGLLEGGLWDAAAGDYVYDVGYDDAGEQTLVRKLIREPF